MKTKNYPSDCKVKSDKCQPIIVITYNECTFSLNDSICKTWTQIGDTFLWPKGHRQKIMILEFLFPFRHLNFSFLFEDKKKR